MFSNLTVGILMGLGVGAWVYSKLARSTGGNTKNSLIGAVLTGGLVCLIITTVMGMISR